MTKLGYRAGMGSELESAGSTRRSFGSASRLKRASILMGAGALSLAAVACGDDSDSSSDGGSTEVNEDLLFLDANGDGKLVMGVATPGPRDDGGYYQALVQGAEAISEANGFEDPIIVDEIPVAEAATELRNLARQNVDIIAVGAGEIGDPLPEVSAEFPDLFWYCNCGAGMPEDPNYAQSQDDNAEISFTAGYATALLLEEEGAGSTATFIGNQGFDFEVEAVESFRAGMAEVDESYSVDVVNTGSFDDVSAASEAANSAISSGSVAIYPFLGGALEPVVQIANDNDVITMSAGASGVCDDGGGLEYQIAVRFDAADYLQTIFDEILSGDLEEGSVRLFKVGVDPQPGAQICDPTDEQQEAMDDIYQRIADGEFTDTFNQIKSDAYGF